jgi:hypothetical protein
VSRDAALFEQQVDPAAPTHDDLDLLAGPVQLRDHLHEVLLGTPPITTGIDEQ